MTTWRTWSAWRSVCCWSDVGWVALRIGFAGLTFHGTCRVPEALSLRTDEHSGVCPTLLG